MTFEDLFGSDAEDLRRAAREVAPKEEAPPERRALVQVDLRDIITKLAVLRQEFFATIDGVIDRWPQLQAAREGKGEEVQKARDHRMGRGEKGSLPAGQIADRLMAMVQIIFTKAKDVDPAMTVMDLATMLEERQGELRERIVSIIEP